jgi:hypothetical protein
VAESPDVVAGRRLLDAAKRHGFAFHRLAPGPDGPLWGTRDSEHWQDTIFLGGFSEDCSATRRRKSALIVPGELLASLSPAGGSRIDHRVRCPRS